MADLVIAGVGLPPASVRGATQTLEPIAAAAQLMRTVNGALVDLSAPAFREYRSTIRGAAQAPPALDGVWPGQLGTVDCVAELAFETATGAPERAVVASRTEGGRGLHRAAWSARFYLWEFRPVFVLGYEVSRARIETVSFTMRADVQRVFSEPGEGEELVIGLASRKVSEVPLGETAAPIGDARRRSYLKTDRGRKSLDYLVALARAKLLARARAVEVRIDVPLDSALGLSCRKAMTVTDPRLPGGSASGKIIGYVLRADDEGRRVAEIRTGCTIGMEGTVAAVPGTATYADDGYVEDGYQQRDGATVMTVAGEIAYDDVSGVPVADDGIDLHQIEPGQMIPRLEVINGENAQRDALDDSFADIPAAVEALNAAHTEVWLELRPLTGGPFETRLNLELSDLMVPRTIAL